MSNNYNGSDRHRRGTHVGRASGGATTMNAEEKPFKRVGGFSLQNNTGNDGEIPVISLVDSSSTDREAPRSKKHKGRISESESDDDENAFQPEFKGGRSSQYRNTASPSNRFRKSRSYDSCDSDEEGNGGNGGPRERNNSHNNASRRTSQQTTKKRKTSKPLKPADKALQLAVRQNQSLAAPKAANVRKRAAPRKPKEKPKENKGMDLPHVGICANCKQERFRDIATGRCVSDVCLRKNNARPSPPGSPHASPPSKKSRFSAAPTLDLVREIQAPNTPSAPTPTAAPATLLKFRPPDVAPSLRSNQPQTTSPNPDPPRSRPVPPSPTGPPQPSAPSSQLVPARVQKKKKTHFINISRPIEDEICYDRLKYFLVRPKVNPHRTLPIEKLAAFSPFAHAASLIDGCTPDAVCAVCGSGESISFRCRKCRLSFHARCLNPPMKHNDESVTHCGACRPTPKSESIMVGARDSDRSRATMTWKIRELASDAAKGNPTDLVLHPTLYKTFVKGHKMDWLRCRKCKRLREITEGVLTECTGIPFECENAYWEENEEDRVCAEPTKEEEVKSLGELEVRISERSRRRVCLFYSGFGEVNRELFGYPDLNVVVLLDSTDEDETTAAAPRKETETAAPNARPTPGASGSVAHTLIDALDNALGNSNSNGANEISPSAPSVPVAPQLQSVNRINPAGVPPAFVSNGTPGSTNPITAAAAAAVAAREAPRSFRAPPALPQPQPTVGRNAPISDAEMAFFGQLQTVAQQVVTRSAPLPAARPVRSHSNSQPSSSTQPPPRDDAFDMKKAKQTILARSRGLRGQTELQDVLTDMVLSENEELFILFNSVWEPTDPGVFDRQAVRLALRTLRARQAPRQSQQGQPGPSDTNRANNDGAQLILRGQAVMCSNGRELSLVERRALYQGYRALRSKQIQELMQALGTMHSQVVCAPIDEMPLIHRAQSANLRKTVDDHNKQVKELACTIPGLTITSPALVQQQQERQRQQRLQEHQRIQAPQRQLQLGVLQQQQQQLGYRHQPPNL